MNVYIIMYLFFIFHLCIFLLNVTSSQNTSSALIKQILKFENSSKDACDFGSELCIASLAMTCARNLMLLFFYFFLFHTYRSIIDKRNSNNTKTFNLVLNF